MGITSASLQPWCIESVWFWSPWPSILLRRAMDMEDLEKPSSFRELSQEQCLVVTTKNTCSQCSPTMYNMLHLFSMSPLHQLPDIGMLQLSVVMAILLLIPLAMDMLLLRSLAMDMLLLMLAMDILLRQSSTMDILPPMLVMDILLLRSSAMGIMSPLRLAMVFLLYYQLVRSAPQTTFLPMDTLLITNLCMQY